MEKMPKNVKHELFGLHVDKKDISFYVKDNIICQTMVSSPRGYSYPNSRDPLFINWKETTKLPLITHSSFVVSLFKEVDHKQCVYTRRHIYQLKAISEKYDIPIWFVCHAGKIPKDMSKETALTNFKDNLDRLHEKLDFKEVFGGKFKFMIENDAGSKGAIRYNQATGLLAMKRLGHLDKYNSWLRFCFDTQHSWCSGMHPLHWKEFVNMSSLIHMNAIPFFTKRFSHLDRHGECSFPNSRLQKYLVSFIKHCIKKDLFMIFEVNSYELMLENMQWLRRNNLV